MTDLHCSYQGCPNIVRTEHDVPRGASVTALCRDHMPADLCPPSVQPPTREQIAAKAANEVEYRVRTVVARVLSAARHDEEYPRDWVNKEIASGRTAVLALFPQPTPSAESRIDVVPIPRAWLERLMPTLHKHADAAMIETADRALDGTIARMTAAPPSIADMAPGTKFVEAVPWTVVDADAVHDQGAGLRYRGLGTFDPSTIRDVTPPKGEDRG